MTQEERALEAKLRKIQGVRSATVSVRFGATKGDLRKFESKRGSVMPREVVSALENDLQIRVFDLVFEDSTEGAVLCGRSQNSWVDLRQQMQKKRSEFEAEGDLSLLMFSERGSIILENLWVGYGVIVDIIGPEKYDLRFVVPSGKGYKINLSLPQYVDYLVQARGLFPWQLMFIDEQVEGLELGYEFYAVLAAISEGEPILQLPQYRIPSLVGSLAEMAVRFKYYHMVVRFLRSVGGAGYEYGSFEESRGRGYNFITRVEYDLGRRLPDELRVWFYLFDGLNLQWRKNQKGAALKMLPLRVVFGGNPDEFYAGVPTPPFNRDAAHYYNDPSATALLTGLYPFMIDERGDVVIGFERDHTVLYLLDSDITTKTRLQVTLPEFIEWLCKTRGISGWHTYLVDPNEENPAELRAIVDEVFPGTEW